MKHSLCYRETHIALLSHPSMFMNFFLLKQLSVCGLKREMCFFTARETFAIITSASNPIYT